MVSPIWIPELLEHILLNIDIHTLFTSQRVCRFWEDLITGSKAIQQDLFLCPLQLRPNRRLEPVFNPILLEMNHRMALEKKNAFLREEASWRRMLVRQPPTSKLGVLTVGQPWPLLVQAFRERNDALRMGLLFTLAGNDVLRWERMCVWTFREICSRLPFIGSNVEVKKHLLKTEECDVAFYRLYIEPEDYKSRLGKYLDCQEMERLDSP